MISDAKELFVWIWLPGFVKPIVAGKLDYDKAGYDFIYGKSYFQNVSAIAFHPSEMPLRIDHHFISIQLHSIFCDSLPDAWGRRILLYKYPELALSPINMLLLSSSDRIGALHFQHSSDHYQPQYENHANLEELMEAASYIEQGKKIPENLAVALFHGTSIGGARPKALIETQNKKYIAKFSSSQDIYPIVQAEYAAMWLAKKINLQVADVELVQSAGKYVLLVNRFDRVEEVNGWSRKFMISALTLLGLSENEGRYASYLDLSDQIKKYSEQVSFDLHELYRRMIFNILIGNTDDHAKNHAFFWNGRSYSLTPAYDICPYFRVGQEATQAMTVGSLGSLSSLKNVLSSAERFQLSKKEAAEMIDQIVDLVRKFWPEACEQAQLTQAQQQQLTGTAVLNPYCFY